MKSHFEHTDIAIAIGNGSNADEIRCWIFTVETNLNEMFEDEMTNNFEALAAVKQSDYMPPVYNHEYEIGEWEICVIDNRLVYATEVVIFEM